MQHPQPHDRACNAGFVLGPDVNSGAAGHGFDGVGFMHQRRGWLGFGWSEPCGESPTLRQAQALMHVRELRLHIRRGLHLVRKLVSDRFHGYVLKMAKDGQIRDSRIRNASQKCTQPPR